MHAAPIIAGGAPVLVIRLYIRIAIDFVQAFDGAKDQPVEHIAWQLKNQG